MTQSIASPDQPETAGPHISESSLYVTPEQVEEFADLVTNRFIDTARVSNPTTVTQSGVFQSILRNPVGYVLGTNLELEKGLPSENQTNTIEWRNKLMACDPSRNEYQSPLGYYRALVGVATEFAWSRFHFEPDSWDARTTTQLIVNPDDRGSLNVAEADAIRQVLGEIDQTPQQRSSAQFAHLGRVGITEQIAA